MLKSGLINNSNGDWNRQQIGGEDASIIQAIRLSNRH